MVDTNSYPASVPLTRTEWVNHRLRRAILSGELKPGEKLVATALAAEWNVSPTPLREAFVRLAESHLVELTPQRGARVADVSLDEATEIFELRLLLEPVALKNSLANSDETHLLRATTALARLEDILRTGSLEESIAAHQHFHAVLLERGSGIWLRKFCQMLSEHSGRYQMLSPFDEKETTPRMHEHHEIVSAMEAGHANEAEAIMRDHLRSSLERIRKWIGAMEEERDNGEVSRGLVDTSRQHGDGESTARSS